MMLPILAKQWLATLRTNKEALSHIYMNTKGLFAVNCGL
jgi:hypothetical protein